MTTSTLFDQKRPVAKIACVGEVMIELSPRAPTEFKASAAGDTFNTAVYLSRALKASPAPISYVTALGTDHFSEQILVELVGHGLNTDFVERRSNGIPGLYAIHTDKSGERSFSYWRCGSAARSLFSEPCQIRLASLDTFDLVFLSGITMAILPPDVRERLFAWAEVFSAAGGTVVYDSNHRPRLWESVEVARAVNTRMWGLADIALPSVDDEMLLFSDRNEEEVVARLRDVGVSFGLLKRGAAGPLDIASGESFGLIPKIATVVDSTAAGDSFNAGYLAALIRGDNSATAARAGHELASHVISYAGAIVPELLS